MHETFFNSLVLLPKCHSLFGFDLIDVELHFVTLLMSNDCKLLSLIILPS